MSLFLLLPTDILQFFWYSLLPLDITSMITRSIFFSLGQLSVTFTFAMRTKNGHFLINRNYGMNQLLNTGSDD